jgi:alpha-L-rhamnosidase
MTVLGQTTYPGFGFELAKGATTPWEEWTYSSSMETHDHAMFGGINASLYTQLAGITPARPGYGEVSIAPQVPPGLDHVAASIDTVRGVVASEWRRAGQTLTLDVTIPANVKGTVKVPVGPGERVIAPAGASQEGDGLYSVGSGAWSFRVVPGAAAETPGTIGGTVRPTLSLTLGAPATFGTFAPGVAHDYTASTSATVTSTAGDAALAVSGDQRLRNGAFALASPLSAEPAKASWTGPVANDPVAVAFKQHVGAGEPLRTGSYSATLTFTLSTTTP